jgi:hypothetical protein
MTLLAIDDRTRRLLRDRLRVLPADGEAALGVLRLRALLEELGVHCDDSLNLQDLDAVLLASERGTDALVASRLDDSQRHAAYARLVARLVITDMHAPIDAKMEYAERHEPSSTREREEEALVLGLASALLTGRLESTPRPLYDDVPQFTFAFTPRSARRSTLGGLHRWSVLWYKRSDLYRRLRARPGVSDAIGRICGALDPSTPSLVA